MVPQLCERQNAQGMDPDAMRKNPARAGKGGVTPDPSWSRQYDAEREWRVEVGEIQLARAQVGLEGRGTAEVGKKVGLWMQSPASQQPRSPDLRCSCLHL